MNLAQVEKSTWVYVAISFLLFVVPFIATGRSVQFLIIQIFVFGIFAMSYDLLLGYTGIISFGHVMFFGVGAYSTAVLFDRFEPTILTFLLAIIISGVIAGIVSLIVGLLTLRLKSHFYAMLTRH